MLGVVIGTTCEDPKKRGAILLTTRSIANIKQKLVSDTNFKKKTKAKDT